MAFCLVADKLVEVNDRLVQNPHVATLAAAAADRAGHEEFVNWVVGQNGDASKSTADMDTAELAGLANGLSLVNLNVLLSQGGAGQAKIDEGRFRQLKKSMIERQCQGLVEFVETKHTLELVAGHEAPKQQLKEDAELILHNRLESRRWAI